MQTVNNLKVALAQNKWLEEILGQFEEIDLPDSWLVAGCIAQTIWNLRCKQPAELVFRSNQMIQRLEPVVCG